MVSLDDGIDVDRGGLREQPLSANEKQLLSEYFQLEGRRQFESFQSVLMLKEGRSPGLFDMLKVNSDLLDELSEKKLSLELSQREHWTNLIKSVHDRFYDLKPARPEIMLWSLISIEKHAIVQIETGKEEYKNLLAHAQEQQLPLIGRLGESRSQQFTRNINLFYDLLDVDGLSENLIGVY
jgi:hypothetical protein